MDNEKEFLQLWHGAHQPLKNYIGGQNKCPEETEDLLQEVAVIAMIKFTEYDRQRPFLAWLKGIARRQVMASRRRFARSRITFNSLLLEEIAEIPAEAGNRSSIMMRAVHRCFQALDARSQAALRLRYWEDLKPQQIAIRWGVRGNHIRVILSRARSHMRTCLKREVVPDWPI